MLYDKIKKIGLPVILGITVLCLFISVLVYKGTRYIILEDDKEVKEDATYYKKGVESETIVALKNTTLEEEESYVRRRKSLRDERKANRAEQEKIDANNRAANKAEGYVYSELSKEEKRYNKLVEDKKQLDELREDKKVYLEAKKVGETNGILKTSYVLAAIAILMAFLVFPLVSLKSNIEQKNFKPLIVFGGMILLIGVLYLIGKSSADVSTEYVTGLVDKLNWSNTVDDLKSGLVQTNGLLIVTYVLLGISLLGIVAGEVFRLVKN